jgi:hypothetical protein
MYQRGVGGTQKSNHYLVLKIDVTGIPTVEI